MATTSTMSRPQEGAADGSRAAAAADMLSRTAAAAAEMAGEGAARLPGLANRGWTAFIDANRRINAGTDERLTVGTAASFGFAVGLMIGGASRILVAAAFVPVAMMGLTLLDRAAQRRVADRAAGPEPVGL